MNDPANAQDRMRSLLILVATGATIIFNGLAATGYVNGVTPEVISDRYPTVLTPAGYAFSIWTLIYVGLIAFSIYQMLGRNLVRFRSVRSLYVVSCVLNCLWIYFWHREQVEICFAIIAALLLTLITILLQLKKDVDQSGAIFTTAVFGVYGGWVTAATLVNLMILLKSRNIQIDPGMWNVLGVIALLAAAAIAVIVRFSLRNYLFPLAVAWAATAIAVAQSGNTVIVVACSACVIVCLIMAASFVMDKKGTLDE